MRLAIIFVLLASICPGQTVTLAQAQGTVSSSTSSFSLSAYAQAAHHCMVIIANSYNQAPAATPLSDTAGNAFTNVIAYVGGNSNNISAYVAYNVTANASNVVTFTWAANPTVLTVTYYDVATTGNCTSSNLDVHAKATGQAVPTQSQIITTTSANEAIICALFSDNVSTSSYTPPTGFTAGPIVVNYATSAYRVVSTIQSSVTLSFTSVSGTGGDPLDMLTVSLTNGATSIAGSQVGAFILP